jgi:hypothetical protein
MDVWISIIVSSLAIFFIFLGIWIALRVKKEKGVLHNIYRDRGVYPSLSRFQALLWTIVFAFTMFSSFLVNEFQTPSDSSLTPTPTATPTPTPTDSTPTDSTPALTSTLIAGALAAVAFGQGLSENKYGQFYEKSIKKGTKFNAIIPNYRELPQEIKDKIGNIEADTPRKFITMLMEKGKIDIARVQLFVWTWIAILIYLVTFFVDMNDALVNGESVSLPNIDQNLLVLSGLSQAGFVAAKAANKKAVEDDANKPPDPDLLVATQGT